MRRTCCLLLLALLLLLPLGCEPTEEETPSTGAPAAEEAAAPAGQAGGDVEGLWEGLPLCRRAQLMEAESADLDAFAAQSQPPGRAAAYTCGQDVDDVLALYRDEMPDLGWEKTLDLADDQGGVILWEQDGWSAQAMVAVEEGETILLLGVGPKGAALLPSEGIGPTATPRPTNTPAPTPTPTPRPAGLDAQDVFPQALAAAEAWGGEVVLLKAHSNYDLSTKEGGLDLEGKALDWTFHFARAHPESDETPQEWLKVTVSADGVTPDPYQSMLASSAYQIADMADWAVGSAEAFQFAEANGGQAYREAMDPPPPIRAELQLACMTGCGGEKGLIWEVRYLGAPDQRVFEIDAATGDVLMAR